MTAAMLDASRYFLEQTSRVRSCLSSLMPDSVVRKWADSLPAGKAQLRSAPTSTSRERAADPRVMRWGNPENGPAAP
jgi:hypothetical protein